MKTSLKSENNKIFMWERKREKQSNFHMPKWVKQNSLQISYVTATEVNETSNTVFTIYQSKRCNEWRFLRNFLHTSDKTQTLCTPCSGKEGLKISTLLL